MKLLKSPYLTACFAVLTSFSAFFCWLILDYHYMVDYFVDENGPIENLTLVAYVVSLAAILYYGRNTLYVRTRLALTIMLSYMFMREADMHKWLNGLSILKIKFWLSSDIPLNDKLWAAAILAPVLWMLCYFLKNYARQFWTDFWRRESYAISIFVFLAVLVISKIFDRGLNVMTELWGWEFDIWIKALLTAQEEFLECILPVLVMIAVLQYRESHEWKPAYVESPLYSVYLVILTSFTALIVWAVLPSVDMLKFVEENGTVENLTLVFYVIAILVVIFDRIPARFSTKLATIIMLSYMFMREADWHKSLSSESILKIKFWLGSHIPVSDKLLAIGVLIPVAWMIVYFVWNYTKSFWKALWEGEGYAISILMFLFTLVASKVLDRSLNMLTELYQMYFPEWLVALQTSQEEFLECLLPILIIVVIIQYKRSRNIFAWD